MKILVAFEKRARPRLVVSPCSDPSLGDCWLWPGAKNGDGYAQWGFEGKMLSLHRVTYELFVGPFPEGTVTDHLCRVRSCCNPAHLEAVSQRTNVLRGDRSGAGRKNREKTHCLQGHPYDEANTYITPTGKRACRACNRVRSAAQREKRVQ